MVPLTSLVLPILLAAALVFVASAIAHMVLPVHRHDFRKVPDEDRLQEALRPFNLAPGNYALPHGAGRARQDPQIMERFTRGPVALLLVLPSGPPRMGGNLVQWFLFCLLVSVFAAYVTGRALGPGEPYLAVFRLAGATAFAAYGVGTLQQAIWGGKTWAATLRSAADGLVYALLTAGAFGWLWPR